MIITKNKKAYYNYQIIDNYRAGIVLVGSEVKSIRNKDVSIKEAYCLIIDGEMWLRGMHISQFKEAGTNQNHQPVKDRKLLLNKKEIIKLEEQATQKGLTIIPLSVIINEKGKVKIGIGLGKGKKLFDKKQVIRDRDIDLDVKREVNRLFS